MQVLDFYNYSTVLIEKILSKSKYKCSYTKGNVSLYRRDQYVDVLLDKLPKNEKEVLANIPEGNFILVIKNENSSYILGVDRDKSLIDNLYDFGKLSPTYFNI